MNVGTIVMGTQSVLAAACFAEVGSIVRVTEKIRVWACGSRAYVWHSDIERSSHAQVDVLALNPKP